MWPFWVNARDYTLYHPIRRNVATEEKKFRPSSRLEAIKHQHIVFPKSGLVPILMVNFQLSILDPDPCE